ncbi:MAG: hypothetical protein R3C28_10030 [Pirellulaceae bacterium]
MRNQPAIIALALAAIFSSRGDANRIYEYHSPNYPQGIWARVEVTSLPVDSVDSIASITFLDPADPDYQVSMNSGISLINQVKPSPEGGRDYTQWGWLNVEWDPNVFRPSWFSDPRQIVEDAGLDQHPTFEGIESDTDIDLYIEGGFNRGVLIGSLYVVSGEPIGKWVLVPEPAVFQRWA